MRLSRRALSIKRKHKTKSQATQFNLRVPERLNVHHNLAHCRNALYLRGSLYHYINTYNLPSVLCSRGRGTGKER